MDTVESYNRLHFNEWTDPRIKLGIKEATSGSGHEWNHIQTDSRQDFDDCSFNRGR